MKNFAIKTVWFCTIFVFVFVGLCQTNITMPALASLFIVGNILILFMVYTVLIDKYTTTKTFKNWYEDRPVGTID
ncbi:hypothetical protein SAMN05444396_104187 [Flavobacterium segetis]|uniref:Uncharacterized protein n=1 Tax=Flavobacterium segetis TaxID=271157 RepID=A0A1M5GVI1_9FLAO|nr:hypothetical protein [Flavobacterium segetis]SHG07766.1 hypothetical protein SAMN05444396_104187 [Flavobacterium segetis]